MISKTRMYISDSINPYRNLAVEEYLLGLVEDDECILYLWQNSRTVVIGRNQNAFKECKTQQLAVDGGFLARRLSGGGSVYHDMGNLNFTFLVQEQNYNVERQLSVIVKALETFGLRSEKTGRNDICIDGKKFSGNAFYKHKGRCYHHGTILVDVDLQKMSHYLYVSDEKLRAHSVPSVKSRVVNVKSLNDTIGISNLQFAIKHAFVELYAKPHELLPEELDARQIQVFEEKYASDEWRFGKRMKAQYTLEQRFPWGEIAILLQLKGDMVSDAQVFSDALDEELSEIVISCLKGVQFDWDALTQAMMRAQGRLAPEIQQDILNLIKNQERL